LSQLENFRNQPMKNEKHLSRHQMTTGVFG